LGSSKPSAQFDPVWSTNTKPRTGGRYDPLSEFARHAAKGGLTIRKGRTQDFFFLVQDDELAIISTRPFFGEVSDRTGFMRVQGLVTRKPALVGEIRCE
jgi:hypothetical protein